jgi:hypothetical protein
VAGRKAEPNHVFLGVSVSLTEFLDPNTKGTKELSFIDHPLYLENSVGNRHEQNSLEETLQFGALVILSIEMPHFTWWTV